MKPKFFKSLPLIPFGIILFCTSGYAQGEFVYTNNNAGVFPSSINTVSGFEVNPDGSLTEVAGSPFETGAFGGSGFLSNEGILVNGTFIYVANNGSSSISVFSINSATGFLTAVAGSPFSVEETFVATSLSLAISPDNRFLMVGWRSPATTIYSIAVFSIGANGTLTPISGSPFSADPNATIFGMKVSPNGKFLFVALSVAIAVYAIDNNGSLAPIPGSPFPVQFPESALTFETNCDGTLLFASDSDGPGSVIVFGIGSDGALTRLGNSPPVPSFGANVSAIYLSPDEKNLFASDFSVNRSIAVFNVAANGGLTIVPGSPFSIVTANSPPESVPAGMVTNSAGTFLYSAIYRRFVGAFGIASSGALTQLSSSPYEIRDVGFSAVLVDVAAYPAKTCRRVNRICLQDETAGNLLEFDSDTGEYVFTRCSDGFTLSGTGTVTINGCTITLTAKAFDRRITATVDTCQSRGNASIVLVSKRRLTALMITDNDTTNNTCHCPNGKRAMDAKYKRH